MSTSTSNGVDLIEFLLTNYNMFHALPQIQKQEVVSKRPTPQLDLFQYEGSSALHFDHGWYSTYDWLTGCLHRNKLYCFTCLIFGDSLEISELLSSLNNFHKIARAHEISKTHIKNKEMYIQIFREKNTSTVEELQEKGLQKWSKNILKKSIYVFILWLRKKNNFLCQANENLMKNIIDFMAINDIHFPYGWESKARFITMKSVQDDILDVFEEAIKNHIKREISNCDFVSIQIDDLSDMTCKPTFTIIFRYLTNGKIQERFAGFYSLPEEQNCEMFFDNIMNILRDWGAEDKLICVSCDSEATEVSIEKLKERSIMSLHSVNYNLNAVLIKYASVHPEIKEFAGCIVTVVEFFTDRRREERLRSNGFSIPKELCEPGASLENFIWTIKTKFSQLEAAIKYIILSGNWDLQTTCMAKFIRDIFQNEKFIYLLCVFSKVFVIADQLSCVLRIISFKDLKVCLYEIHQFLSNIRDISSVNTLKKIYAETVRILPTFKPQTKEQFPLTDDVMDFIFNKFTLRFEDYSKLECFQLIDEENHVLYQEKFPYRILSELCAECTIFDSERLQNELSLIYEDPFKRVPAKDLLVYFIENGLTIAYEQSTKLIELYLTFPICLAEINPEKRPYERAKRFVQSYNSLEKFNQHGMILIEESIVDELINDEGFMNQLVNNISNKQKIDD